MWIYRFVYYINKLELTGKNTNTKNSIIPALTSDML